MTAHPSMQTAIDAVNEHADAYLVKPFDVEKLLELIREQLRLQKAEKRSVKRRSRIS
jgi:DNA-binding NtrC family response regulator